MISYPCGGYKSNYAPHAILMMAVRQHPTDTVPPYILHCTRRGGRLCAAVSDEGALRMRHTPCGYCPPVPAAAECLPLRGRCLRSRRMRVWEQFQRIVQSPTSAPTILSYFFRIPFAAGSKGRRKGNGVEIFLSPNRGEKNVGANALLLEKQKTAVMFSFSKSTKRCPLLRRRHPIKKHTAPNNSVSDRHTGRARPASVHPLAPFGVQTAILLTCTLENPPILRVRFLPSHRDSPAMATFRSRSSLLLQNGLVRTAPVEWLG